MISYKNKYKKSLKFKPISAMSTRLPTLFGSPKIDILTNRKDYYSKNMNLISIYEMRFL